MEDVDVASGRPVGHITDVTLMLDCFSGVPEGDVPALDAWPRHFREEVRIYEDLYIGPLRDLRGQIYDACQPKGMNWVEPTRNFPIEYGIYRCQASSERRWIWDPDQRLQTCLMLSRLVRPTSIGVRYAARLIYDPENSLIEIAPANISGTGTKAWVVDESRNWLRDSDIPPLRTLLQCFDSAVLSSRVSRAFWHFEHGCRNAWIDARWPIMTIALEALVHTDRYHSTRQFVERISALAERIDGLDVSEDELSEIYNRRSELAHGQGLGLLDNETRALYLRMEEVLRRILETIVLDPDVAAIFENTNTIRRELGEIG